MSKRIKELFLFDILIAIEKIKNYSAKFQNGLELKHDCKSWDAVIREFEIIGEATNNLIKIGYFSNNKREIVNFRNVLIHEYFGIDEDEIWDIITNFLNDYQLEIIENINCLDSSIKKNILNQLLDENRHIDFIVKFLESLK